MRNKLRFKSAGFTLIEVTVGLTILIIIVLTVTDLFVNDLRNLALAKSRAIGVALANEKMENLRDLPYDSLATQHGTIVPAGNLADDQTVIRDNYTFRVHTQISYVDDPYDGNATGSIPGKPVDLYPYDYKKMTISIFLSRINLRVAILTSNVAAKAAETSSNTGILSIKVIDANGNPVPQANVHITNSSLSPHIDIVTTTDNTGLVVIPKLPPDSNNHYNIVATLAGYSSDQTYAKPGGSQTAVNPNPNVLVQKITNVTLAIDKLSTMNVSVVNTSGSPLSNLLLSATGQKLIYLNPNVFKTTLSGTTNAQGAVTFSNIEWDSYSFSLPTGYYIVSVSPYQPVPLNPNISLNITITVSNSSSYPSITQIAPVAGATNNAHITLTITGKNFSGVSVRLRKSGQADIVPSSVTLSGSTSIKAVFSLVGAAVGSWDVVVTNANGQAVTQIGGFSVTAN